MLCGVSTPSSFRSYYNRLSTYTMVVVALIYIAGGMKALSDLSAEGNSNLPLKWRKSLSWKNKWELSEDGEVIPNDKSYWYYLWAYAPPYLEKFPLSSTWLVSLTDFWHKVETVRIVSMLLSVVLFVPTYNAGVSFILLYLCWNIGFSSVYEVIKRD